MALATPLPDDAPRPAAPVAPRRAIALSAILVGLVVAAFEATVVTTAMPTIAKDLGGMEAYPWVFSSFLIASTFSVLVCGKLADALGRKPVFTVGMALFLFGSLACGTAQTMWTLVAFRFVQGVGAGALQPIAMTISADLFSLEERAKVQAVLTSVWGISSLVGPVLGAFIVMHLSWRWVFLVNLAPGVLSVVLLHLGYRDPARAATTGRRAGLESALFAGLAACLLLVAIEPVPGLSPLAHLALRVLGLGAVVAFVLRQRTTKGPLLPLSLLAEPAVQTGFIGATAAGATLYATTAYVPLWLSRDASASPLLGGAALVLLLVGWSFGSTFGVRVLVRHGMRASVGGGFALSSLGLLTLAVAVRDHLPLGVALAALFVTGLGLGPASSTGLVGTQARAPWRHRGSVTSAIFGARTLGGSLAVAALAHGADGGELSAGARFTALLVIVLVVTLVSFRLAPGLLARVGDSDVEA